MKETLYIYKLKHKIELYFRKHKNLESIHIFLVKLNFYLFHLNLIEHKRKFGTYHKEKTFYVIRSSGNEEGLLSQYIYTVNRIIYALDQGYFPIVDFENYHTQYKMNNLINNTSNAWEYFFNQPINIPLCEVYKSKNVILSGQRINKDRFKDIFDINSNISAKNLILKHANIQEYIWKITNEKQEQLFGNKVILGVFLRGTDYTHLQPKGHNIQPKTDEVIKIVNLFISKYKIDMIFLATEDETIRERFVFEYKDKIVESDKNYIRNYDGKDYIYAYSSSKSPYQTSLDYLIKMLLLSKCDYLVTSLASGSRFAIAMNNNNYKDKFIFDIGRYE